MYKTIVRAMIEKEVISGNPASIGNPAGVLDHAHHTRTGGAHWYESRIRESQGFCRNQFHPYLERELEKIKGKG